MEDASENIKSESIPWKNTDERYGRLAMILHWTVALLFLLSYMSVYYRQWFTEAQTDINWLALQLHLCHPKLDHPKQL